MLTEQETEKKLIKLGKDFQDHVAMKAWGRAHYDYRTALAVAVFMELSEDFKEKLFGTYGVPDGDNLGVFCRSDVHKVEYEACVRRDVEREKITGQMAKK